MERRFGTAVIRSEHRGARVREHNFGGNIIRWERRPHLDKVIAQKAMSAFRQREKLRQPLTVEGE